MCSSVSNYPSWLNTQNRNLASDALASHPPYLPPSPPHIRQILCFKICFAPNEKGHDEPGDANNFVWHIIISEPVLPCCRSALPRGPFQIWGKLLISHGGWRSWWPSSSRRKLPVCPLKICRKKHLWKCESLRNKKMGRAVAWKYCVRYISVRNATNILEDTMSRYKSPFLTILSSF